MRGVPGLLSKGGAEGVIAVAVPGAGAVAMKIDDGAMRPRLPILVRALRLLGVDAPVLTEIEGARDAGLSHSLAAHVLLGGGVPVGEVRPTVL